MRMGKTTTTRRTGPFVTLPSFAERVMTDTAMEALRIIARRQKHHHDTTAIHMPRSANGVPAHVLPRNLAALGLVEITETPKSASSATFKLTRAGWEMLGDVPLEYLGEIDA